MLKPILNVVVVSADSGCCVAGGVPVHVGAGRLGAAGCSDVVYGVCQAAQLLRATRAKHRVRRVTRYTAAAAAAANTNIGTSATEQ